MLKKILKKKKTMWGIGIIIIIVLISIYYFTKSEKVEYNFSLAERQDLIQEISATGRVKAVDEIDLAFEKSGRVSDIYIDVGDVVYKGQVLAELESAEAYAELAQARAGVSSAEAKLLQYEAVLEKEESELETLEIGTREEEILIYQSKVENAEAIYRASIQSVIDKVADAYTKSDDAIRNKIDSIFVDPQGSNPQIVFTTNDSQLEIDIEWGRFLVERQLITWGALSEDIDNNLLPETITETENKLGEIKSFLENIALAVNNLAVSSEFTQTTIDGYKTDIYTARTNINTAVTNLSTAKKEFATANTSLLVAQNELALKEAGGTLETINSQKAVIKQAEANIILQLAEIELKKSAVQASLARLSKNTLKSPIAGTVTTQDAKVGAIVSGGEIIISVISENNLEIESNIVEADIAYLRIGNKAKLSLDAYGEEVIFEAEVVKIDPAAKLIEGVANYKITLELIGEDERIRAGMTADIDITTMELSDVIVIPYRAIIFRNGVGKFVRILKEDGQMEEVLVETGMVGDGSLVEVVKGINEGDKIITSIKK